MVAHLSSVRVIDHSNLSQVPPLHYRIVERQGNVIPQIVLFFSFFFKVFGRHMSFFWGHWYPCFGFLVTSPLGFKARVGSALYAIFAEANVTCIPQDSPLVLHLLTSWQLARSRSLPHMHVQRWDLAQIRTCNRTNRRRTRYHCASDPALFHRLYLYIIEGKTFPYPHLQ